MFALRFRFQTDQSQQGANVSKNEKEQASLGLPGFSFFEGERNLLYPKAGTRVDEFDQNFLDHVEMITFEA
jgi:hypothetical protein